MLLPRISAVAGFPGRLSTISIGDASPPEPPSSSAGRGPDSNSRWEPVLSSLRQLGRREGRTSGQGASDAADRVERILRAAKLARSGGTLRLRLQLAPRDLGDLRLDLWMRRKTLKAMLRADRPSSAEAILARWPELKETLERQGFDVGEFAVAADGGSGPAEEGDRDEPSTGEPASLRLQIMDLKA